MDKIYTGNDKAHDLGFKDLRDMTLELIRQRGLPLPSGEIGGEEVWARVDFGRWIADCECGGAAYVEPSDPIFFCVSCGNASNDGKWRKVIFPRNREEIEHELLERQVLATKKNLKPVDAAMNARSLEPGLSRSWRPGETINELRRQRGAA